MEFGLCADLTATDATDADDAVVERSWSWPPSPTGVIFSRLFILHLQLCVLVGLCW